MTARNLVVSLHDVSRQTWQQCPPLLADLAACGVKTCSLLVIPNHHRRGHFLTDLVCCEWLRQQSSLGHEIVAHGYYHERARRAGETFKDKFMTRFYTADEGEFYDLDRQAAATLLANARADFAQLGVVPQGFIAPAWLLGADAESALREQGWDYTTRLRHVKDLRNGRVFDSSSLVWSVRSVWRRIASLLWNPVLFRTLRPNRLLRISIHPVDAAHPAVWRQIRSLVARAVMDREPVTYQRWITQQRAVPETVATPDASPS